MNKLISAIIASFIMSGCVSHENEKKQLINLRTDKGEVKAIDDRSTDVSVVNWLTGPQTNLVFMSKHIDGGEWKKNPPKEIPFNSAGSMGTTSNAWLTGAGGWVRYKVQDDGTILTFKWYNPYAGGNTYSATTSDKRYYITTNSSGSGNNASMTWYVRRNASIKNYTAVIMADPQPWRLAEGDPNSEANRTPWLNMNKKVANSLKSVNAAFYIVNGDLTEYGRKKTYNDYKNVYSNLGAPVYESLGDHDYDKNAGDCIVSIITSKDGCAVSAVNRMYYELLNYSNELSNFDMNVNKTSAGGENAQRDYIYGSLSYSWDYGDIHYIHLQNYPTFSTVLKAGDTTVRINDSLTWLKNDLSAADARGKVTIINLHNPRQNTWNRGASDLSILKHMVTSHNVKAVFAGHTHVQNYCRQKDHSAFGTIPVYMAGALFNGEYYVIDVKGKEINVKAYQGKSGVPVLKKDLGIIGANKNLTTDCSY